MARNIYITAMGPYSGKSIVALGFMEMLSARLERIGFFRPIIRAATEPDPQIELMRDRYQLEFDCSQMYGATAEDVTALIAHGAHEEIEKRVLAAYRELERRCDFVVCEGSDFVGSAPALDFDLNANLANQLGCPVLVVINGAASSDVVEEVQLAREELQRKDCELFGVIVNRVAPDAVDEVEIALAPNTGQEWVYVMPEHAELDYPSVGEIQAALGARPVLAVDGMLDRDVREVRVAAMSAEHFIEDLGGRNSRGGTGRSLRHRRRVPRLDALSVLPHGRRAAADGRLSTLFHCAGTARDLALPGVRDRRAHAPRRGRHLGRQAGAAGAERAQDRHRPRCLRAQRGQGRAADALHGGATGADDADDVRVRADREGEGGAPAHRAARGRG